MAADVMAKYGARASTAIIFTYLNRGNSVPRTLRVKYILWNCPQVIVTWPRWQEVNIGFAFWIDAVRQQAIAWANVDRVLCHHNAVTTK